MSSLQKMQRCTPHAVHAACRKMVLDLMAWCVAREMHMHVRIVGMFVGAHTLPPVHDIFALTCVVCKLLVCQPMVHHNLILYQLRHKFNAVW